MTVLASTQILTCTALACARRKPHGLKDLILNTEGRSRPFLLAVDTESQIYTINSGLSSNLLGKIECPTKAQTVWVSRNMPTCFVVSLLGSTSILNYSDGSFTELEQAQTKLVLSDTTIALSDLPDGWVAQASRYWVNIFSSRVSCMYRPSNGERVIALSSSTNHFEVVVAMSEGDLVRGKSKIFILEFSHSSGMIVEKHRRELNHEIIDVRSLSDGSCVAITADKSILFISPTLAIQANLVVDYPLRSLTLYQDKNSLSILVSTSTGIVLSLDPVSHSLTGTRVLSQRPVVFGTSTVDSSTILAFSPGRYFSISNSIRRFHPPKDTDELVSITLMNSLYASVTISGDVLFFQTSDEQMNADYDFNQVSSVHNLSLNGPVLYIANRGYLFLGGPSGFPVYMASSGTSEIARSFPSIEGCTCGVIVDDNWLLVYSVHEKSLIVYKLDFSSSPKNELEIIRIFSKPIGSSQFDSSSLVTDLMIVNQSVGDDTSARLVAVAFSDGEVQMMKINFSSINNFVNIKSIPKTVSPGFPQGHSYLSAHSRNGFVLVHSLLGVFTLTSDLQFTSVSPSFVDSEILSTPITCSCVLDQDHILTGDEKGNITLYKIPSRLIPSSLHQCMLVSERVESVNASQGRINRMVHCRDKRNIVYFASDDPGASLGFVSRQPYSSSNWYWD